MDVNELKSFKIKELTKLSQDLGVQSVSGLNKQELIALILKAQAEKDGVLYSKGVLEVMSDGYGFLRSPDFNYLPGSNDIYVSPSQIKRFRLRTGHLISGQIRPPKSKERFHALLKIDLVNDHPFEEVKNKISFDNLTPFYPEENLFWKRIQKICLCEY